MTIFQITQQYYLHTPFCHQKCPYCKFALTPIFDATKKKRYFAHLRKEIQEYFTAEGSRPIDTLYFGGGTPSILTLEEMQEILSCFPSREGAEISFEANPEDITSEYVNGLILLGVNRISLGIQSLNSYTLASIQRSSKESIFLALDSLEEGKKRSGKNISINIDFILGLPHSGKGETLQDIKEIHSRYKDITHTSVYMLEDELYPRDWKKYSLNGGEIQEDFREILSYFESLGWNHYELSNFSKRGYECRHNQGYWTHKNYKGFGLSSSSFKDNHRWNNMSSFSGYYKGEYENEEFLDPEQLALEKMMFGLRTDGFPINTEGIDINQERLSRLLSEKFLEIIEGKIIPTKTGIFILDYIMSELISPP